MGVGVVALLGGTTYSRLRAGSDGKSIAPFSRGIWIGLVELRSRPIVFLVFSRVETHDLTS
jgi:hypothetical protein